MHLSFVILFVFLACLASADVFNITTCFCHGEGLSENDLEAYTQLGSYHSFDYWNAHLDHTFSLNVTTSVGGYMYPSFRYAPPAAPVIGPVCVDLEVHNELCYWRRGRHHHGRFAFNRHVRKLPHRGHSEYDHKDWALPICQERCISEVGLPYVDESRSTFGHYPDLKPVCEKAPPGLCPWRRHPIDNNYRKVTDKDPRIRPGRVPRRTPQ